MIPKVFNEITHLDIINLMENKVPEGSTLEYKSDLPHKGDSKKIPFLAEVSAFANTSGGDLIFGVYEENGFIKSIEGIGIDDPDKEILRLDNIIRSGIEPRLPSVHIKAVPLDSGKFVFIIRVPQSWNTPHRVIFNDHSKFYGRSSAGKFPLDVSQLRSAFLSSERVSEKIHAFRKERAINLLTERQQLVKLENGGRLVLHILPLSSFTGVSTNIIAPNTELAPLFPPFGGRGCNHRVNLEGFLTYSSNSKGDSVAYCQVYRSGIVEAVTVLTPQDNEYILPSVWYEQKIMEATKLYLTNLSRYDIEAPLYLALSLVGMKGYQLRVSEYLFRSGEKLDRDLILLPEAVLDDYTPDIQKAFRPIFDMVWNAFGHERSFNYNDKGEWKSAP